MRKLIVLTWLPVTRTTVRHLQIDELRRAGADVECWDLGPVCLPGVDAVDPVRGEGVTVWKDIGAVRAAIARAAAAGTVFLPYFPPAWQTLSVYRALAGARARVFALAVGYIPYPRPGSTAGRAWGALRSLVDPSSLRGRARNLAVRAARRLGWVKPFDVVFCAGSAADEAHRACPVRPGFNFFDFEEFVRLRGAPRAGDLPAGAYAVFLDSYLPHHSDFRVVGMRTVEAGPYYAGMRGFFDRVERDLGLPVVVAAHPKADPALADFGGRSVYQRRTGELTRDCSLVMAHTSASVSFAVLGRKPVFFLHSAVMRSLFRESLWPSIRCYAEELGMPLVDVEADAPPRDVRVDEARYEAYKYRYLTTPESEGRRNYDIIMEHL